MRFDLSAKAATVTYDPSVADPNAIRAAIDRANDSMAPDDDGGSAAGRVL